MTSPFPSAYFNINHTTPLAGVPVPPTPRAPLPLTTHTSASPRLKGNQQPDISGVHLTLHLVFLPTADQKQRPQPTFQNLLLLSSTGQAGQKFWATRGWWLRSILQRSLRWLLWRVARSRKAVYSQHQFQFLTQSLMHSRCSINMVGCC